MRSPPPPRKRRGGGHRDQIHGCLAGLGTGAYVTLSALGLERLTARTEACRACPWHSLASEIHRQTERAARFLSAWGRGETITCTDEVAAPAPRPLWDAKNPPLSRRDLFVMMARQGQMSMARAMENEAAGSKHQSGRDRLRLLSAVSHLPAPSAEAALDGFHFAALTISEACNACGACAKACPTEALRFEKDDEEMTFSISFSARQCIGCDICDHVCLPDAVRLDHAPTFQQVFGREEPVVAASGRLVRYERCRSWTVAREGTKLCDLCEFRRTHPFGSVMPPKAFREPRS